MAQPTGQTLSTVVASEYDFSDRIKRALNENAEDAFFLRESIP